MWVSLNICEQKTREEHIQNGYFRTRDRTFVWCVYGPLGVKFPAVEKENFVWKNPVKQVIRYTKPITKHIGLFNITIVLKSLIHE